MIVGIALALSRHARPKALSQILLYIYACNVEFMSVSTEHGVSICI